MEEDIPERGHIIGKCLKQTARMFLNSETGRIEWQGR